MNSGSFEERSVWVQLVSTVVGLGAYFAAAGLMMSAGVTALVAYVPLFAVAVVFMILILVAGHIVAALTARREPPDERDRLIVWRAESNSAWVLGAGVIMAVLGMVAGLNNLWIAHGLLLSLFVAEVLAFTLRIVYYRRGIGRAGRGF